MEEKNKNKMSWTRASKLLPIFGSRNLKKNNRKEAEINK